MGILIFYIIQLLLAFLSFWLPFKCGRKDIGLSASIVIVVIYLVSFLKEVSFTSLLILPFISFLSIVFVIYWFFRYLKWNKIARLFPILAIIFFIFILISPWLEDWMFNKEDARDILKKHNINLKDDIKLLSNESGGFRDYYHTFKIDLSKNDYKLLKNKITDSSYFVGILEPDESWNGLELKKNDTVAYEDKLSYVLKIESTNKFDDGTHHFEFSLSKENDELVYTASN